MSGVSGEFLFYTLTNGHAINWPDRPPLADRRPQMVDRLKNRPNWVAWAVSGQWSAVTRGRYELMGISNMYYVEVRQQGCYVACHLVEAAEALTAINLVEQLYGEPVIIYKNAVEDKDGCPHPFTQTINWHGYTFEAWAVEPVVPPADSEDATKQHAVMAASI